MPRVKPMERYPAALPVSWQYGDSQAWKGSVLAGLCAGRLQNRTGSLSIFCVSGLSTLLCFYSKLAPFMPVPAAQVSVTVLSWQYWYVFVSCGTFWCLPVAQNGLERNREWDPPVGMFLLPRVELAAFCSATLLDIIPESFLLDYSLADLRGREEGKKVIRRSTIVLYIFSRMC